MAQISRPFQIALLAVLLLAGIWLFALQGHSSSTSSSPSAPAVSVTHSSSAPAPSSSASLAQREAAQAAAPTPIYHGSAPGVEGLTRAIAKAHEAVAISQGNANALQGDSSRASGEAPASPAGAVGTSGPGAAASPSTAAASAPSTSASSLKGVSASAGTSAASSTSKSTKAGSRTSTVRPTPRTSVTPTTSSTRPALKSPHAPSSSSSTSTPAGQRAVEAELKSGEVAVILFWNPSGFDDQLVHEQVQRLGASAAAKHLAVHESRAGEVTSYGAITRGLQVYSTPTILVIDPHGQAITITGVTDSYAIEQAIQEVRSA